MAPSKSIVGGGFQDALGNLVTGNLLLILSQDAHIASSGQVAPVSVRIPVNGGGIASTPIWFNDQLSPNNLAYTATVYDSTGNKVYGPELWALTGAGPVDLSTLTPLLISPDPLFSNPVLQNPSAAQTITGQGLTLATSVPFTVNGTQTNTGALNLTGPSAALLGCRVEGIRYVDVANLCGWSGTDLAGWIASAFNDLTNHAGTVVVTNGAYTTPAASITVGVSPCVNPTSTGYGQTLIFDNGVTFTENFPINVLCGGMLTRNGSNVFGGWIIAGASLPAGPMIQVGDATNGAINASVTYMRLNCNSVAGCVGINAKQINDDSEITGNLIQNHMGDGIQVDGTAGVTGNFWVTKNLISASASATTANCMKFTTVQVAHVFRNSCVSSSAGNQSGAGAYFTGTSTVGSSIFNLHCEKYTDCVKSDSVTSLNLNLIDAGNGTTNAFHIYAGGTGTYEAHSLANNGNGAGFPVVKNDISGTSISSANPPLPNGQLPFYSNVKGDEFWMDGTQILYSPTSSAHVLKSFGNVIANNLLLLGGTLQNTTQTATMGLTLKTGSGSANYTGTNTALAAVDTTNLCTTITVPTGWKLSVVASGVGQQNTAAAGVSIALADAGATCTSGGITALSGSQRDFVPPAIATNDQPFATQYVLTGDGNAHSIALMAKTANTADAWVILNGSTVSAPSMTYTLMPSN